MFHIELMFEERTSAIKHIWLDCSFLEIYPHTCLHYGRFAWKNLESKLCSSEHGILKLMFCFLYFYWITLEYFFLLNEWFFFKKWVLVVLLLFFFYLSSCTCLVPWDLFIFRLSHFPSLLLSLLYIYLTLGYFPFSTVMLASTPNT